MHRFSKKHRLQVKRTLTAFGAALVGASLLTTTAAGYNAKGKNAETHADIRCVIAGARLAAADPKQRTNAMMLLIYYIGRIDGRTPNLDLERLVDSEAAGTTSTELESEIHKCSAVLLVKGRQITRIGRDLKKSQ